MNQTIIAAFIAASAAALGVGVSPPLQQGLLAPREGSDARDAATQDGAPA